MEFFNTALGGLLSVNTICLKIGDYPLSYIEAVGTVAYFLSVWLMVRKHMLTWPIGIVSVVLFGILFYQIQLYADTIEQVYYLLVSLYGWAAWQNAQNAQTTNSQNAKTANGGLSTLIPTGIPTRWSSAKGIAFWLVLIAVGTALMTYCIRHFHIWFPVWFPTPADYPLLDALTTVMSFVAMYLLTIRRNEAWVYWITVDVIAIGLYWVKGVKFISIQYMFLLAMACYGLYQWQRNKAEKT